MYDDWYTQSWTDLDLILSLVAYYYKGLGKSLSFPQTIICHLPNRHNPSASDSLEIELLKALITFLSHTPIIDIQELRFSPLHVMC